MKTILLADDHLPNRELISEVVSSLGHRVVEASDGEEALQKAREISPDLILLDIQMPKLDGFEVLKRLRQDSGCASCPVVALTAYAMRGDREKGLAAGFDGYVTKPIDVAALMTEIEKLLA